MIRLIEKIEGEAKLDLEMIEQFEKLNEIEAKIKENLKGLFYEFK